MTNKNIMDYMNIIESKIFNDKMITEKQKKINNNEDIIIPTMKNISILLDYKYTLYQLKFFTKHYRIKNSGTKKQLIKRIYLFIFLSYHTIKIQKIFRGYLQRIYNKLHGPAWKNRSLCNNLTDFLSFEELKDIKLDHFFSFKDKDNFIYGFEIISIYNLIYKNNILNCEIKNPYNRNIIDNSIIKNIKKILKIGKIMGRDIPIKIKNTIHTTSTNTESRSIHIELKAIMIFHNINLLGNYSDSSWFLELNINKLIYFIIQLCDIWNFRAGLNTQTKRAICPPQGDPFLGINFYRINNGTNIDYVRNIVLEVLDKFVNGGINTDNKKLGCYYVLSALTLANENAANALPWLYESVSIY